MRSRPGHLWLVVGLLAAIVPVGCQSTRFANPFTAVRDNIQLRQANRQCQQEVARLQARVQALNEDNEELHRLLAREQFELRRLRAQVASRGAPPQSPRATTTDSTAMLPWEQTGQRPGVELAARSPLPPASASSRRTPKAFRPVGSAASQTKWKSASRSSSVATAVTRSSTGRFGSIPIVQIPGADVFRDGEVVRIRLRTTRLFDPGKATLRPEAIPQLRRVAKALKNEYRDYVIGIEGHTDADPIRKSGWGSNHELAVERALAVFEYLSKREGIPTRRLFVAGYGPLKPIAPNTTATGKARNRRVEFVIYPRDRIVASRSR